METFFDMHHSDQVLRSQGGPNTDKQTENEISEDHCPNNVTTAVIFAGSIQGSK